MTLLPSSSTHRTLSLSLSPSHQRPRYSVLAAAFPPLPFQLPSRSPRSRAPPTSNSAFHSLRSPFETCSFSLSLYVSLSFSLYIPSLPLSLRSRPTSPLLSPSPSPSSAAYLSDSRPLLLLLLPSRTLSLSLPPAPRRFPAEPMSRQPPPFDHGQTDRRSDRRPRQTAASDSSDSAVNDEEIRIDRSSADERISILHFEEFSKGFGENI